MAKFYGSIGFVKMVETSPDVWEPEETVKKYCGDLKRNQRRWDNKSDTINEDLTVSNEVSIIADKFACENIGAMKWVEVMGCKWKINSVTIEYPRITMTVGGVYNGG